MVKLCMQWGGKVLWTDVSHHTRVHTLPHAKKRVARVVDNQWCYFIHEVPHPDVFETTSQTYLACLTDWCPTIYRNLNYPT
jgi:hypothetical protein